jgi:hypothetical protein
LDEVPVCAVLIGSGETVGEGVGVHEAVGSGVGGDWVGVAVGVSVGVVAVTDMSGGTTSESVMPTVSVIAPGVGLAGSVWNSIEADASLLCNVNPTASSRAASRSQVANARISAGKVLARRDPSLHVCIGLFDPVIVFLDDACRLASKERDLARQHQQQAAENDDVDQDQESDDQPMSNVKRLKHRFISCLTISYQLSADAARLPYAADN